MDEKEANETINKTAANAIIFSSLLSLPCTLNEKSLLRILISISVLRVLFSVRENSKAAV